MTISELDRQFGNIVNEYVEKFCKKHDLDFDGWVGNDITGIASFSCQYYFNLSDIIFDINTRQPKRLILEWQSDGVDAHFAGIQHTITFKSYTLGLRYEKK